LQSWAIELSLAKGNQMENNKLIESIKAIKTELTTRKDNLAEAAIDLKRRQDELIAQKKLLLELDSEVSGLTRKTTRNPTAANNSSVDTAALIAVVKSCIDPLGIAPAKIKAILDIDEKVFNKLKTAAIAQGKIKSNGLHARAVRYMVVRQ
jgi:hypothetical protein